MSRLERKHRKGSPGWDGETRTSAKSPEKNKNIPPNSSNIEEEKVGHQMTVANLNKLCNTLCKKELSSGLARAAKITTSLQTENENKHPISIQILSEQTKWFGRRQ